MKDKLSLLDYYKLVLPDIMQDEEIQKWLMMTNAHDAGAQKPLDKMKLFIEEAEVTIGLLDMKFINKKDTILEVGAGIGLCFIYLQKSGYNVWAIEPAQQDIYSEYTLISKRIFSLLSVDSSQWMSYPIERIVELPSTFKFIFSNFVLEHVNNTETALITMYNRLSNDGTMIHNTVNYNVPYEPHLNILLIPAWPEKTSIVKRALNKNNLWFTLNFISYSEVSSIAKTHNYNCVFRKQTTYNYLERLEQNSEFRKRKKSLYIFYKLLKRTKLLSLTKLIPTRYNTPLTFEIIKK